MDEILLHERKRKLSKLVDSVDDSADSMESTSLLTKKPRVSEDMSFASLESSESTTLARADVESIMENHDDGGEWQTAQSKKKNKKNKKPNGTNVELEKGAQPTLRFHAKQESPVSIKHLQELVVYILADGVAPSWLAVKNAKEIKKVVVLLVPGLEKEMFDGTWEWDVPASSGNPADSGHKYSDLQDPEYPSIHRQPYPGCRQWENGISPDSVKGHPGTISRDHLPRSLRDLAFIFDKVWTIRCPGDSKYSRVHSPLQALLISPLPTTAESKSMKGIRPPREENKFRPKPTPITSFIHIADELNEAEYPIHPASFTVQADADIESKRRKETNQTVQSGWSDSHVISSVPLLPRQQPPPKDLSCGLDVYSLDCEMVLTTDDVYSLARISMVNWAGKVVMDKYVKPSLPIKDYFTQFSGITPAHLENIKMRLSDIQAELMTILTPSSVLLGHSLNSDLCAMKMTHPFLVDTSIIYPHPRGLPLRSSLKFLAQKYLRREIQNGGATGHDSVEDARAVLDLVRLKCEKGPKWGTSEAGTEPIWRRLRSSGKKGAIVDWGTPERGLGKEADLKIECKNDEEAVEAVKRAVGEVDFVCARLRGLEYSRGWARNVNAHEATGRGNGHHYSSTTTAAQAQASLFPEMAKTISHISAIHALLTSAPSTLFIVYSGTGKSMTRLAELQEQQQRFKKEFKVKKWDELSVKWTDTEEQEMKREAEAVRGGCGFFSVVGGGEGEGLGEAYL